MRAKAYDMEVFKFSSLFSAMDLSAYAGASPLSIVTLPGRLPLLAVS